MSARQYRVLSPVKHGGRRRRPGEVVEIDAAEAAAMPAGLLEEVANPPENDKPEAPTEATAPVKAPAKSRGKGS